MREGPLSRWEIRVQQAKRSVSMTSRPCKAEKTAARALVPGNGFNCFLISPQTGPIAG